MKPTVIQSIFAKDWPVKIYLRFSAVLGASVPAVVFQPTIEIFSDWQYLFLFVLSVVLGGALGFFVLLPVAFMFLGPLYYLRAWLNGAPFHIGDRVCILVGPNSGRVVNVYEVWTERHQVRVALGEKAKAEVTDVFSYTQVCREITGFGSKE